MRGLRVGGAALGLLGTFGCSSSDCVEVTVHETMPTYVDLSWETKKDGPSFVSFGQTEDLNLQTPDTDLPEATLRGLPAGSTSFFKATTEGTLGNWTCEGTVTLEPPPEEMPDLGVTVYERDKVDEWQFLFTSVAQDPPVVFAVDRTGGVAWSLLGVPGTITPFIQAAPVEDHLLYGQFDADFSEDLATVYRTSLTGEILEETRTPEGHHTFFAHDDGSVAYLQMDVRDWYDEEEDETIAVSGDAIAVIDSNGALTTLFSIWDWMEPEKHERWDTVFYTDAKDWSHGNALTYNPESNSYLLSLANLATVLEVDRETGTLLRRFGDGGYDFSEDSTPFEYQHGVHWTEDGTLLMTSFVDGSQHAIEYSVDETTETLTEIWSHAKDEHIFSYFLGQALRLGNGNTLVNFGSGGMIREVTPEGEVVWELHKAESQLVAFGDMVPVSNLYSIQ